MRKTLRSRFHRYRRNQPETNSNHRESWEFKSTSLMIFSMCSSEVPTPNAFMALLSSSPPIAPEPSVSNIPNSCFHSFSSFLTKTEQVKDISIHYYLEYFSPLLKVLVVEPPSSVWCENTDTCDWTLLLRFSSELKNNLLTKIQSYTSFPENSS